MSIEQCAPAIACNRFGLGARAGELAEAALGPREWLRSQLSRGAPPPTPRSAPPRRAAPGPPPGRPPLQSSAQILAGAAPITEALRAARRSGAAAPPGASDTDAATRGAIAALMRLPQYFRPLYQREVRARSYA